jgi:DNA polymerase III subunit epsilon
MFAIIDIETCGGKFEFRKGRITEICIIRHDGLTTVDSFTTLINPECMINPYFTKITGITNEMVADAPRFHEVASKIVEMTEGCVFVAHNVSFDYGFIKDEFHSLGYNYQRETLCTVRLSRKLIPGRISYSLGHLCAALGIEIFGRHRAEGDAVATVQLFELLLRLKADHPQYKSQGVEELMTRRVDKIKEYILKKIPESCGVYYFLNSNKEIIYIGKSTNMYARARSHFQTDIKKNKKMLFELMNVDFIETGSELIALLLEAEEIKIHQPLYNRMRKREEFTHAIDTYHSAEGVIQFKILPAAECEQPLLSFNTYSTARERLESWIEEHELCLRYCGLTAEDAVCFHHQIRKCRGICAGEEDVERYNERASKILQAHQYSTKSFVIVDRGRERQEQSLILVEKGKYKGYGYSDSSTQINTLEDLRSGIRSAHYYPDTDAIIRTYLKNSRVKILELKQ